MNKVSGQRDGLRLPIQLLVSLTLQERPGREDGFTMDLSPGGCCLSVKAPLPVGHRLTLQLHLPDDEVPISILEAEVRWSIGNRSGMEFRSVSRVDQDRLRHYLGEYDATHGPDLLCHLPDLLASKRS